MLFQLRQWSVPSRGNDGVFSLCHYVQTGSGAHPASCPLGTRGSYPRVKCPGHGDVPLFPQYVFMVQCLVKHKDNFASVTQVLCGVGLHLLCPAVGHPLQMGCQISLHHMELGELQELLKAVRCHCQPVSLVMKGM